MGEGLAAFNLAPRAQRARTLSMLLIPLDADYTIPLRRAPTSGGVRGSLRPAARCLGGFTAGVAGRQRSARVAPQRNRSSTPSGCGSISLRGVRADPQRVLSTWSSARPCPRPLHRPLSPSISAPGRACWPRFLRAAASSAWSHRYRSARSHALARTWSICASLRKWRWSRPTCFPKGAPARGLQPALGPRAPQLAAGARHLRSRKPHAARIPARATCAPRAGRRRLAGPFGSRGASGTTVEGSCSGWIEGAGLRWSIASTCGRGTQSIRCERPASSRASGSLAGGSKRTPSDQPRAILNSSPRPAIPSAANVIRR